MVKDSNNSWFKDPNPKSEYQLFQALKVGKIREAKEILQFDINVNYEDPEGKTALQVLLETSVDEPNHEIVVSLLEKRAYLDCADSRGRSLFMLACEQGYTKIVELMLQYDPPLDMKDLDGNNAIMVASQLGYTPIVRILIASGATVYAQNDNMWTALMFAASAGNKRTVNELLNGNSNLAVADGDHQTAMILAAQNGNVECCRLLINHNAKINAKDRWGQSCLFLASGAGHTDVVKLLLESKTIDVNAQSNDKRTPLDYACEKGRSDIVELLKGRDAIPNTTMGEAMFFTVQEIEKVVEMVDSWAQAEKKKNTVSLNMVNAARDHVMQNEFIQEALPLGVENSLDAWQTELADMVLKIAEMKPSQEAKSKEHLDVLELESYTFIVHAEVVRYSEHRFKNPSGICACFQSPQSFTKILFELYVTVLASKTPNGNRQLQDLQHDKENFDFFKRKNKIME